MSGLENLSREENDQHLFELARFSWERFRELAERTPKTREGQVQLVKAMTDAINDHVISFRISRYYLVEIMKVFDEDLLRNWESSPLQLAWLLVSEQLSDFCFSFCLRWWKPKAILIHHVMKAGGTSISHALAQQGEFVAYSQTEFDEMTRMHGLLGFSKQVDEFRDRVRASGGSARLYLAGHFNLNQAIEKYNVPRDVAGVSLCREPLQLLSSALRYVWTRFEKQDPLFVNEYTRFVGITPRQALELRIAGLDRPDSEAGLRLKYALLQILLSSPFVSQFYEVLVRYYLDPGKVELENLGFYLQGLPNIFVCTDLEVESQRVLDVLGITQPLSRENVSSFGHSQLLNLFSAEPAFRGYLARSIQRSEEIFKVLLHQREQTSRHISEYGIVRESGIR